MELVPVGGGAKRIAPRGTRTGDRKNFNRGGQTERCKKTSKRRNKQKPAEGGGKAWREKVGSGQKGNASLNFVHKHVERIPKSTILEKKREGREAQKEKCFRRALTVRVWS